MIRLYTVASTDNNLRTKQILIFIPFALFLTGNAVATTTVNKNTPSQIAQNNLAYTQNSAKATAQQLGSGSKASSTIQNAKQEKSNIKNIGVSAGATGIIPIKQ